MNKTLIKRWGIFVVLYTVLFILLFKTLKLTAPFIISLLVTTILYKPTIVLKNKFRFKSTLATTISVSLFYLLTIGLLIGIITGLAYEIRNVLSLIDTNELTTFIDNLGKKIISIYNGLDPSIVNIMTDNLGNISSEASLFAMDILKRLLNLSFASVKNIPYTLTAVCFSIISTFFMLKGAIDNKYTNSFITNSKYYHLIKDAKTMLFKYCGSFLMIIGISFLQILILLLICGVPNSLLLAVLSAILDVLPIVGMAIIMIPLGLFYVYKGLYLKGIIILIGYTLICIIRQVIEPKIMSTTLNISPLSSIMAIFIGLNAYGFVGMIFCMFFVVLINVVKSHINNIKQNNSLTP